MQAELAALRESNETFQAERQRLDQLETQFGQIRQVFAPSGTSDSTVEYFTNPQAHLARIKEEAKIEALASARQERFWENFYGQNPELEGMESFIFDTIRGSGDLAKLAFTPSAAKRLAGAVRQRLATIAGVGVSNPEDVAPGQIRLVEGGGGTRQPGTQEAERTSPPVRPRGVSDLIRAQREARRKAAQGA
jgi:hypothetical protein